MILVRHAQAVDTSSVGDRDRKLTKAGQEQADRLAAELAPYMENLAKVFVSPTARARETWRRIAESGKVPAGAEVTENAVIYAGAPESILDTVRMESEGETVMVIGHEPTISETARLMVKPEVDVPAGIQTGSAVIVGASHDWKEWHSHVAGDVEVVTVH